MQPEVVLQLLVTGPIELVYCFAVAHKTEGGCVVHALSRLMHVINLCYHVLETRKLYRNRPGQHVFIKMTRLLVSWQEATMEMISKHL